MFVIWYADKCVRWRNKKKKKRVGEGEMAEIEEEEENPTPRQKNEERSEKKGGNPTTKAGPQQQPTTKGK